MRQEVGGAMMPLTVCFVFPSPTSAAQVSLLQLCSQAPPLPGWLRPRAPPPHSGPGPAAPSGRIRGGQSDGLAGFLNHWTVAH